MKDYENRGFIKRNAIILVVVAAVVIFAALMFKGVDKVVNEQVETMTTVTGNFSCLPLQGATSTPSTANCMLGVKSHDGTYYALDISRIQDANTDLKADDTIAVTGFLQPESSVAGTQWAIYNVKGIIKVNTLLRTR